MNPLEGRGALVTGGGRGIGAAVAEALAAEGAAVVVTARRADEIKAVAGGLRARGRVAHAVVCDVTDPDSVAALAIQAQELLGSVDILVNNAGVARSAPFLKVTLEQWEEVHRVNATGVLLVTQAFLPAMLERGWGRIVNVASVASLIGARYITAYAASKHAMIGMARCLADELGGTGVTVNSVCPSYVDTPMTEENIERIAKKTGKDAEAIRAGLEGMQPGGRLITPREVAHAVMTFMPEESGGVAGQRAGGAGWGGGRRGELRDREPGGAGASPRVE